MDIMKLKVLLNVNLVTINVILVLQTETTVPDVKEILSELLNQLVTVLMDIMMMVSITNYVYLVVGNVLPVKVLLITVLIVEKTDLILKLQNVHVHSNLDIMKFKCKLIVHHVLQNVTSVLNMPSVKDVKPDLTEKVFQNVHVKMDIMNKELNVYHVLGHVEDVLELPPPV
jgi:hypothetical protein